MEVRCISIHPAASFCGGQRVPGCEFTEKKKRNSFRDREEEDNEIPQISGESHGFYSLVRLQRISVNFCSISFFCPRVPVRGTVSFN